MTYDQYGGEVQASEAPAEIHPRDKKRDIVIVVGKTGMGKTQWVRQYIRHLPRVIALDPMEEYEGMVKCETMTDMIDLIEQHKAWHVRYEYGDQFDMLCKIAWTAGNCALLIEEAQRMIPPAHAIPKSFEDIVYRGRHHRVSLIVVAQRAHTVNIMLRSQWTGMVVFRQTEKADVAWLQDVSGFDLDPTELKPLEFYMIKADSYGKGRISFAGRTPHAIISESDTPQLEEKGE